MKVRDLQFEFDKLCKYTECDVLDWDIQFDYDDQSYFVNQMKGNPHTKTFHISGDKKAKSIGMTSFPIGMKELSLEYRCLHKNLHTVLGETLTELNYNLSNHVCECYKNPVVTEENLNSV